MENPVINMTEAQKGLTVTSLSDLQSYAKGQVVELPAFGENQPFVARMKRPSMLALVKSGQIPNQLLSTANDIFQGGVGNYDAKDDSGMKDVFKIMDVICEASLLEPTYSEIKEAGLELSDDQLLAIFAYTQQGVDALKDFRKE